MERRATHRERTDGIGSISIDEHSSVGCIVYVVSENGIRVTLPQAEIVPSIFVLTAPFLGKTFVCEVAWRNDESIGAKFRV
ncbi:PilZ domain-containing protein [Methylobacterium sp. WL8]|uniref:PilZ domain-containing protein n=1 Tax=Methylobacterium sp. WL8 TaxID=2603899 RepID=UPI0011C867F2|nr:PilZ domain-containing protein [Methylobacterium sp. WL8]TXN74095.1 PilZ domain-containing protein [Methylobacterium sp. WL8]